MGPVAVDANPEELTMMARMAIPTWNQRSMGSLRATRAVASGLILHARRIPLLTLGE